MKLHTILFSFLLILLISCTKNTGVIVTNPDSNLVLDKIRYGNFQGIKLEGNILTITGSKNGNNGIYKYVDYYLSISADFVSEKGNNLWVLPAGSQVYVVSLSAEGKELVELITSDNPEYSKVLSNILKQASNNDGKIDTTKTDELLKDVNLSESELTALADKLIKVSDDFAKAESIK
ncbi:hypothetical protein [Brachyspira intermedia]|uniref:hypothetical protein n=1 Tax=Brachyspira intermedia TaxID=84377 RepID=UPI0030068EB9